MSPVFFCRFRKSQFEMPRIALPCAACSPNFISQLRAAFSGGRLGGKARRQDFISHTKPHAIGRQVLSQRASGPSSGPTIVPLLGGTCLDGRARDSRCGFMILISPSPTILGFMTGGKVCFGLDKESSVCPLSPKEDCSTRSCPIPAFSQVF